MSAQGRGQRADSKLTEYLSAPLLAVFSAAYLPVAALTTPLGVYLPNYYVRNLGVPFAVVAASFGLVRLIDIILDLFIGLSINSTRTPVGRFRPWMFVGAVFVTVASYKIFMAAPGITESYIVGWLLALYAGFSILSLGLLSWAAALVPRYHHRSQIYGWITAAGVVGSVGALSLPLIYEGPLHQSHVAGIRAMGWFIVVVGAITVLPSLFLVREPAPSETDERITLRDYWTMVARPSLLRVLGADVALASAPAITAVLYLFFFPQVLGYTMIQTYILLIIYIFASLFGAPTWSLVAKRLGKHSTLMLSCVLYGFAQALVFVLPHANMWLMVPGMFVAGFVVSAFAFLVRAMIADISDEVRLDIGKDRTSLLYGLVTSTSKIGSALAVLVTFRVLPIFGFKGTEGAHNTPEALNALTACYVVVPVLVMFIGAAMLRGYKLDAVRHDAIRASLAERDLALASAADAVESLGGAGPVPLATPQPGLNPGE